MNMDNSQVQDSYTRFQNKEEAHLTCFCTLEVIVEKARPTMPVAQGEETHLAEFTLRHI